MPNPNRWHASWPRRRSHDHVGGDAADDGASPLRAELLSAEQMEQRGRELAAEHGAVAAGPRTSLLRRLADNEHVIRDSCAALASAIKSGHRITPAGEWLLDNLYLVDEQVRTARRHLPERYGARLPRLARGPSAGLPRVYDIALNAISHGDGRVDQESLIRFIGAYQQVTPLALGELWAIPIMLRLALIENLRRVAWRVRSDRHARDLAARWANEMVAIVESDPKSLILVVSDMARSNPPMHGAFVAELLRVLQAHSAILALPLTWIEQRLQEAGMTVEQRVHASNQEEAADQVSISNSIGSLRVLDSIDWRDVVERESHLERILRGDPADVYAAMDFRTRDSYRHVVERIARDADVPELEVARRVVELAKAGTPPAHGPALRRHVGFYLVGDGAPELARACGIVPARLRLRAGRASFAAYFAALLCVLGLLALPPAIELLRPGYPSWLVAAAGLATLVALGQLAVSLVNQFVAIVVPPRPLPRMALRDGIGAAAQTLVVVPSMLGSEQEADDLVQDLELRFLANRDPHLLFALLTDFSDAATPERPTDDALLAIARDGITRLNQRHAEAGRDVFFLLHRPRRWNEGERSWIGFERKRGKLGELNALLRGHGPGRFHTIVGDIARLQATRYVITLDADTQLPHDSARALVATMEHPLNRPCIDPARRCVTAGYGILQPRVGTSFSPDSNSRFAMLFGGEPGIDPYTRAVSDTYQDLFGEGSFVGKGIYDVDTFEAVLADRFPLNRILSHDLLEGCYARSGLVTDVELYEHYPSSYVLDAKRRRRWIRGDWQIAEWLLPSVPVADGRRESNPLSALSRWKVFDNLRRSLVPVALLAMLLLGWTLLDRPRYWTLLALEVLLLPALLDIVLQLARKSPDLRIGRHLLLSARDAGRRVAQLTFNAASLPYEAWQSIDAIARTAWRVYVSRRRSLRWVTSRAAQGGGMAPFAPMLWVAPLVAAGSAVVVLRGDVAMPVAATWLLLWFAHPALVRWLGRAPADESERLDARQATDVRRAARRTWAFFERFVGPEDNWLPPDNYQEQPIARVAHRTSPTNIGLCLLANLSARDLGYIGLATLIERTARTFATMRRLERYRGHFYNWYDTLTLQPLLPQYVSTVDSGNLIGHLWTLRQGLRELVDAPVVSARVFAGLADSFEMLHDGGADGDSPALQSLRSRIDALERAPPAGPKAIEAALRDLADLSAASAAAEGTDDQVEFARICSDALADASAWLAPTPGTHAQPPGSDVRVPTLAELARGEPCAHPSGHLDAGSRARACIAELDRLAAECVEFVRADHRFLFDAKLHLFAIGYNVTDSRRDHGYYDLLASEARLAVFAAIAHGRVPQDAWFALGRLLTAHDGPPALLSWSGSMFEYLMPLLVMPAFPGSLLARSCTAVVRRQIRHAAAFGVPWGISESGYNLTDAAQNYQYRAFGVPGLGLQRGLAQELVIAPYASALALTVLPRAAADNLAVMAGNGWLTRHGFYEAIDYTPARQPPGASHTVVRSFMAHHQGMSLVAFAHALLDRPMQRRFQAHAPFQATLLLLQERVPRTSGEWASDPGIVDVLTEPEQPQAPLRVVRQVDTRRPALQLLSNGRYHVMVSAAGGGYSRWRGLAVTRWREDPTCDDRGTFVYLRDCDSGDVWSTTYHPTLTACEGMEAVFTDSRVEFRRRRGGLDTHTEIVVSPEDDIELRRTRLTNRSRDPRTVEITSYAEVVLAAAESDEAHPAFSNLFVQTEFVPTRDAILCTRRPRSTADAQPWMMHLLAVHDVQSEAISHETDRMRFIGRGRSTFAPRALKDPGELSNTTGSVLDPVVAVRHRFRIEPDQTVCIDLVMGAADTRDGCLALADKYHDRHLADRVIDLAWTHSRVVLGQINVSNTDAQTYARLAECIVHVDPARRAPADIIASNRRGQSGLWAHAISGDVPIVLLSIADAKHIDIVRQLVHAHAYCRLKGLAFDLVIWNIEASSYRQTLHDEIHGVIAGSPEVHQLEQRGGIFVRALEQVNHEDRVLMQSVARVALRADAGSLIEQLRARAVIESAPRHLPVRAHVPGPVQNIALPQRMLVNGIGGFSRDAREYVVATDAAQRTPAPWINVIANPHFGCLVSESGSGYTWFQNAHEYRLTPWSDDPVSDPNTEAFYIRDEDSGHFWSPTPLPAPGAARYLARHGFGYSVFETIEDGIASELRIHVDPDAPVKFFSLRLRNDSGRPRRLSATGYVEWVLGDRASRTAMHVVTEIDPSGAMLARNAYNAEFADVVAFFDVDDAQRTLAGDRSEFIGRNGSLRSPAAMDRASLSGRVGAGFDPCGAIQVPFELAHGESRSLLFRLGAGADRDDAASLVRRFRRSGSARAAFEASTARWNGLLGAVVVETPDHALNALANGWLLYQVVSCRLWGRSGFYQSGGAFGFRDQLQDTLALVHAAPALLRDQLMLCASRQFREGDVQHWWHPPGGRGVRTRCSDDYLWLPHATCRYLQATGDWSVLDERASYLDGRALNDGEDAYYDLPMQSREDADLYGHCVRAIEHGLRFGAHGLPLIGDGDWNDGMNRVGGDGRGESVWLGFFLHDVLVRFAEVASRRDDGAFAARCAQEAERLRIALHDHGWDGEWYRRAYFDDGTPLGTAAARECRIDSIAQSWAVLSGAGDRDRTRRALDALDRHLVRPEANLIALLAPPFDHPERDPGYIRGYVPGVRENGGQYTHAAVWAAMAFAQAGRSERAWALFEMINPVRHGDTAAAIATYRVEPYVMAADVLAVAPHVGRGGWTWYTGAAAWMYRLVIESLLGIRREGTQLRLAPSMPAAWPSFTARYRFGSSTYEIAVRRGPGAQVFLDGLPQPDDRIALVDDGGTHRVDVVLAPAPVD